jgi:outer membrane protein assembly factor BamD
VTAAALVAGCGLFPGKDAAKTGDNLDKLYAEARDDLASGSYDRAIKTLEKVEARSTGTLMGQQALLDLAFAQWKSGERTTSLATLDRFIKMHPSSPAFDYALYLRGLVNFSDSTGFLASVSGQSISERDQRASRDSYQSFKQLVEQYPASKYVADSRLRMD